MDTTMRISPLLNDMAHNTCHEPLTAMTIIPQMDSAIPHSSAGTGFSLFIIHEKKQSLQALLPQQEKY